MFGKVTTVIKRRPPLRYNTIFLVGLRTAERNYTVVLASSMIFTIFTRVTLPLSVHHHPEEHSKVHSKTIPQTDASRYIKLYIALKIFKNLLGSRSVKQNGMEEKFNVFADSRFLQ